MRVIIAGSRTLADEGHYYTVLSALSNALREWKLAAVTEIVSGGAAGVDAIGEHIAERFDIALKVFPADWDKHGKKAGYLRNVQMADYADALVLVWDGKSRGSKMMKDIAEKRGMPVYEVVV